MLLDSINGELPPITEAILEELQDEAFFTRYVGEEFQYTAAKVHFHVDFSESRMHDAYQSWSRDVKHLHNSMPDRADSPDHFKQAGALAYWLRRFSPVIGLEPTKADINCDNAEKDGRAFLRDFGEVYLAFDVGYRICKLFEQNREDARGGRMPTLNAEYIRMVCYFLKYKNVSPHAIAAVYASLFI